MGLETPQNGIPKRIFWRNFEPQGKKRKSVSKEDQKIKKNSCGISCSSPAYELCRATLVKQWDESEKITSEAVDGFIGTKLTSPFMFSFHPCFYLLSGELSRASHSLSLPLSSLPFPRPPLALSRPVAAAPRTHSQRD